MIAISRTRLVVRLALGLAAWSCSGSSHGIDGATDGNDGSRTPDVAAVEDVGDTSIPAVDTGPPITDAGPPPPATCTPTVMASDVSHPTTVVGTGTAGSCTEAAFDAAVTAGGVITFHCGSAPATIALTHEAAVPTDRDTVIDGGGTVTLDGGNRTRLLHFNSGDYRGHYGGPQHMLTVQHLTFLNGLGTGTMITVPPGAPAACSRGYNIDSGGGAILMTSGILHVIDCGFANNHGASPGPDVGGGAVYAGGSVDVTIVGSRFTGNSASNGGAVGMLNADLALFNDTFTMNQATGNGANTIDTSMCPASIHGGEVGNGGNSGAVGIDGGDNGTVTICGCTFSGNTANALGGAFGRTPDNARQLTSIDLSTFDGNHAPTGGGGALYLHNSTLRATNSTFANNSAPGAGAIQADGTVFDFTNVTMAGNIATHGVGGAISAFNYDAGGHASSAGTLDHCTFANNEAHGMNYSAFAAASFGSPFTWTECIVANNSDDDMNHQASCQTTGAGNGSIQWPQMWPTSGADTPCATGIHFADPMLGPLGNHGGTTETLAPAAAASVVQTGTSCPPTDQTGHARAMPCTLGALELH